MREFEKPKKEIELIEAFVAEVERRAEASNSGTHYQAMTDLVKELKTGNAYLQHVAKSKAEKLISRGSENKSVAQAASVLSDLLVRMCLGQSKIFAEIVRDFVFPKLTEDEAVALCAFFSSVAAHFAHIAGGEEYPYSNNVEVAVRSWGTDEQFYYQIHKLFCVLACDLETCEQQFDCWETRGAFCRMDDERIRSGKQTELITTGITSK